MSKKSFKDDNPALAFISVDSDSNAQEVQEVQHVQDAHDTQEVQEVHPTQGKKGKKLPRINMAFSPENLEYLQLMSRLEGISITQYVNNLVAKDCTKKSDIVDKAKEILKGV
ncbi:hypothetical protein EUAN_23980 [Andreesenia angusta]|uniref:Uncharacterized protein n=1 Tax=Andreesenia angusta TaxID=39480 RepID=A0A1S1V3F5_9FIRM|nr:hypothetical protein [Andreesenia angusta]OHW61241.1 hypothetical protein EUAN_23980 [Andreesenia angusta]